MAHNKFVAQRTKIEACAYFEVVGFPYSLVDVGVVVGDWEGVRIGGAAERSRPYAYAMRCADGKGFHRDSAGLTRSGEHLIHAE